MNARIESERVFGSSGFICGDHRTTALSGYANKPCYAELGLMLLTSLTHVILELLSDGFKGSAGSLNRPQHIFNLAAVVVWGSYLLWRLWREPGTPEAWGLGKKGFMGAIKLALPFFVVGETLMLVFGGWRYGFFVPAMFWLVLLLYPLWGIAQQFALQSLVTRNLGALVRPVPLRIFVVALVFSLSHFPNFPLMALTMAAGMLFTWLYVRCRNIWAIGILHGIMGATAYYFVLGQDPGIKLLGLAGKI